MSNWTPHSFRLAAEAQGCLPLAIEALIKEGDRLNALHLPVVFTLGHLASICDVPYDLLDQIVKRKIDPYRKFKIRKRSGGWRQICVPEGYLLKVQRWIHSNILQSRPLHSISMAFASNCNHQKNAGLHSGARWLVKIDVASFFESISERQVYHVFRNAGYPALLAFQLSRLCTRVAAGSRKYRNTRWQSRGINKYSTFATSEVGHLPQGAPTSPMLANLACFQLDHELAACAAVYGCTVSRYADDIVYSAANLERRQASEIIRRTSALLGKYGLVRRHGKTHIATPGSRRVVTGLLVDGTKPKLPKEYRERILLHLYHARTKGITVHCLKRKFRSLIGFRSHLHGLITYAEHIDPVFGKKCRAEFMSLPWGDMAEF